MCPWKKARPGCNDDNAMFRTSYFANPLLSLDRRYLVQVSNSVPGSFATDYRWDSVIPDWDTIVAPFKSGSLTHEAYIRRYRAQLDSRKDEIVREIERFKRSACGREIVFLCYETPHAFCHRHLLAAWLRENGIASDVQEMQNSFTPSLFGDED